jgi:methylmalonyl-CoA mutase C-terminal domain/subunit
VVARALRDAGFEVIYTGIRQTPEMIVQAALQEDVDAIGLSILSGAHLDLFPAIVDGLKEQGLNDVPVFAGGIIPKEDYGALEGMGIRGVFGPGTTLKDIVDHAREVTGSQEASA